MGREHKDAGGQWRRSNSRAVGDMPCSIPAPSPPRFPRVGFRSRNRLVRMRGHDVSGCLTSWRYELLYRRNRTRGACNAFTRLCAPQPVCSALPSTPSSALLASSE